MIVRPKTVRATLLALMMAAASMPASATDPAARAREHYDRAVKLFADGHYPGALAQLERARDLRPSYKLFYAKAQVLTAMNDAAGALEAYRRYLEEGGDRVSTRMLHRVGEEMALLARRVASVRVIADEPGAEVWVDGSLAGTTPLREPLNVNAGVHRITLRHSRHPEQSRRVTLAGGTREQLEFSLRRRAAAPRTLAAAAADLGL